MENLERNLHEQVRDHLLRIYDGGGHERGELANKAIAIMGLDPTEAGTRAPENLWDERDVWAITYADSIFDTEEKPLHTLRRFLNGPLADSLNGVHILPFYPYSSDHGFAVKDYDAVCASLGDWEDVRSITETHRVMSDLVINHCSSEHPWFKAFCAGEGHGRDYFRTIDEKEDLSLVVRPRTSDLRRPTPTANGLAQVWCTFSHDQIDLDFRNPEVLLEFIRIIRHQLDQGVRAFRLDAVAFLWKEPGTPSINLPETHEIVRLLRTLVQAYDPNTILITETNIPNRENLSYFGNGNEAHIVYNFSLPPLLLHTLLSGSCQHLKTWMMSMPPAQTGTCFFNFIASHDGIGLRPAEGLLSDEEVKSLISTCQRHGGEVSWRSLGGESKPYEINIALFDALRGTNEGEDEWQVERFLCAHAIMLGLEGLPAFYINSLLATENDYERFQRTRRNRSLNRHQWQRETLEQKLADPESANARVLTALRALIDVRKKQPAFHPNATQFTLHLGDELFGFWRQSIDRRQSIFCISNISNQPVMLRLDRLNLTITDDWHNLVGQNRKYHSLADIVELAPYETVWISNQK